jgi:acetyl esterase/lipase
MQSHVHRMNVLLFGAASLALAQERARDWAFLAGERFLPVRDVVYRKLPDGDLKLDFYVRYNKEPGPTVFYIFGGGWQTGSKDQAVLRYLPYLQMGYRVVALEYRLSDRAAAPAQVEDCRCALLWLAQNGPRYGVDPKKLVIAGGSAGAQLALITAMLDSTFDAACSPGTTLAAPPPALAVLNYYGPTDMQMVYNTRRPHYLKLFRGIDDPLALAKKISPLSWVRPGLPPVLTIHGDADEQVPIRHATELHRLLDEAKVANELVIVPGGVHGRQFWTDAELLRVQRRVEAFLQRHAPVGKTAPQRSSP